jgi:benzoyl-CoA 2,3-dioxygenase component B
MLSTNVDLNAKIPNNVGLADDVKLQRALEKWQPSYLEWWNDMGPTDFEDKPVYLRTAVSVGERRLGALRAT